MTDEELAQRLEKIRELLRPIGEWILQATPKIARLMHTLGLDITSWALAQGPHGAPELSPALHYCQPGIRRRMAKRRARLITRYHR